MGKKKIVVEDVVALPEDVVALTEELIEEVEVPKDDVALTEEPITEPEDTGVPEPVTKKTKKGKDKKPYTVSAKVLETRRKTGKEQSDTYKKAALFDRYLSGSLSRDEVLLAGFMIAKPAEKADTIVIIKEPKDETPKPPGINEFLKWYK